MKRTQLITTADLTREEVDFLIEEAEKLRGKQTEDLKGKIVASLFFEPSTRTRLSFESATYRLGGNVITVADAASTSMKKGETLADTIRVIEKYADILVMRHPQAGSAEEAIKYTKKPFLNAGDGANQHPTHALLDMLTLKREMGTIDGLTIGLVGDMKYSRCIHSVLYLLRFYKIKKIYSISPEELKLPKEYLELMQAAGIEYVETEELEKNIPELDVLYMTRIQQERFETPSDYEKFKGSYILTAAMVKTGKSGLRVISPLPRVDEIATDVDALEQAAYFRGAEDGMYMRMALLKYLSGNYNSPMKDGPK